LFHILHFQTIHVFHFYHLGHQTYSVAELTTTVIVVFLYDTFQPLCFQLIMK
jgi:hypothetical protein